MWHHMLDRYESYGQKIIFNISFVFNDFNGRDIKIIFLPIIFMSIQHMVSHVVFSINAIDDVRINGVICFTFRTIGILM